MSDLQISDLQRKLSSRKFWISVAAFLGSLGTGIAGIATENQIIATAGIICAALSAAIYAACETYVDAAALEENTYLVEEIDEEESEED